MATKAIPTGRIGICHPAGHRLPMMRQQIDSNLGSSVYSPLRRGLAGVRLEEADEMLGIFEAEKGTDLAYRKHF